MFDEYDRGTLWRRVLVIYKISFGAWAIADGSSPNEWYKISPKPLIHVSVMVMHALICTYDFRVVGALTRAGFESVESQAWS